MMRVKNAKWGIFFFAVVVAAIYLVAFFSCVIPPQNMAHLLGAAVTLGSIMASFTAASLSILIGFDSPLMRVIKADNYYRRELISTFQRTIAGALAFCLCSLGGFFIQTNPEWVLRAFFFVWLLLGLGSFFCFWKQTQLLFKILGGKIPTTNRAGQNSV